MEPAPKRRRVSQPDETTKKRVAYPEPQKIHLQPHNREHILPTRTIDLSDFRKRAFHAYRSADGGSRSHKRGGSMYLMPRIPIATVTAKVIDVAIVDGATSMPITQVAEPVTDLVVSIGTMGTVTIPGADTVTSTTASLGAESSTTSVLDSSHVGTTTMQSGSAASNSTTVTSGENTVTITATSTLTFSYLNGTLVSPPRRTTSKSAGSTGVRIATSSRSGENGSAVETGNPSGNIAANSSGGINNGAGIATPTSSSPPAASSESTGSGITLSPQQQQVVGGVVGGVAGVALVLVALLYFLKWYRQRHQRSGRLPDQLAAAATYHAQSDGGQAITRPETVEASRDSVGPIAVVASRLKQLRPFSTNTVSTSSTRGSIPPESSEMSFQRVAGRKIPSVLSAGAGGDGYGGNYGVFDQSSHRYQDSYGSVYQDDFVNGGSLTRPQPNASEPSTPTRTNPFTDPPSVGRDSFRSQRPFSPTTNFSRPTVSRDFGVPDQQQSQSLLHHSTQFSPVLPSADGYATLRPSPARTPMTQSPMSSTVHLPLPSSTPPLMAGHVPHLPAVPILDLPPRGKRDRGGVKTGLEAASASRFVPRSTSVATARTNSTGGRFREEI